MSDITNSHSVGSDLLTPAELGEATILVLATDAILGGDGFTAEEAVAWARRFAVLDGPWADGKHMGDCTKQPNTCARCVVEQAQAEALRRYGE